MEGGLINDSATEKRVPLLIVDQAQAVKPGSPLA